MIGIHCSRRPQFASAVQGTKEVFEDALICMSSRPPKILIIVVGTKQAGFDRHPLIPTGQGDASQKCAACTGAHYRRHCQPFPLVISEPRQCSPSDPIRLRRMDATLASGFNPDRRSRFRSSIAGHIERSSRLRNLYT